MEKRNQSKYDVFISHSSINKNIADAICADFEQHKIKCWYAPRDIRAGESWPSAIKHGIEEAEILVLVFSENANESRQVINEVSLAYNQGKTIIPFKIANTPMNDDFDYFLNRVHWLDAVTQPMEKSIESLRKYVENILGFTASGEEEAEAELEKESSEVIAKEAADRLEEERLRINRETEEEKRRLEEEAEKRIEAEKKRMEEEAARRLEEERKRIEAQAQQKLADEIKKAGLETDGKAENQAGDKRAWNEKPWILPAAIGAVLIMVILIIVIAAGAGKKNRGDTAQEVSGSMIPSATATEEKSVAEGEASEKGTEEGTEKQSEAVAESKASEESRQASAEKTKTLKRGTFDTLYVNNTNQGGYATYYAKKDEIYYVWPGRGLIWRSNGHSAPAYETKSDMVFRNLHAGFDDAKDKTYAECHWNWHEGGISDESQKINAPTYITGEDGKAVYLSSQYPFPVYRVEGAPALLRMYVNDCGVFKVYKNEKQKCWMVWEDASGSGQEQYQIDYVYHGRTTISGKNIFWAAANNKIEYISMDSFGIGDPKTIEVEGYYINDMTSDDKGNIYVLCDKAGGYGWDILKMNETGILDTYQVPKGMYLTYYDGDLYMMSTVKESAGYVNKVYKYDFSEAKLLYETTSDVNYDSICVVPAPGKAFGMILIYGYDQDDKAGAGKGLTNGGGIVDGGMEYGKAE